MVDLLDQSCGKTDLIAVTGISLCSSRDKFLLWKFILESLGYGNRRVCRASHAHCLINIASSGKRIADRAAKTCGRAAERLDLGGMIVGLIFEEDKPLLCLRTVAVIHLYGHYNRAGIVLIGFFLIRELAVCLEFLHAHDCEIHQADIFVFAVFIKLFSRVEIT